MSALRLFTSESVTEGHPDKICDQVSDSILDALLTVDPHSRVAVETLVTTGLVHVAGEVTTSGYVEIPAIVREKKCVFYYPVLDGSHVELRPSELTTVIAVIFEPILGEGGVHPQRLLGRLSTRSAMMLRRISEVPASIVLPRERSCWCCQ